MTDPTERHMAEADRLIFETDMSELVEAVAKALVQAERRGADAMRLDCVNRLRSFAEVATDKLPWIDPTSALRGAAKTIEEDAAPLATAAPDPAPAADVRAADLRKVESFLRALADTAVVQAAAKANEHLIWRSTGGRDLLVNPYDIIDLADILSRLVERGGRDDAR